MEEKTISNKHKQRYYRKCDLAIRSPYDHEKYIYSYADEDQKHCKSLTSISNILVLRYLRRDMVLSQIDDIFAHVPEFFDKHPLRCTSCYATNLEKRPLAELKIFNIDGWVCPQCGKKHTAENLARSCCAKYDYFLYCQYCHGAYMDPRDVFYSPQYANPDLVMSVYDNIGSYNQNFRWYFVNPYYQKQMRQTRFDLISSPDGLIWRYLIPDFPFRRNDRSEDDMLIDVALQLQIMDGMQNFDHFINKCKRKFGE